MPKILINELDKTSPGTPDSYSNYTVLIAGFLKTEFTKPDPDDPTKKINDLASKESMLEKRANSIDANGVYQFETAEDFEKTIGTTGVTFEMTANGESVEISHYGNRMAVELLKLGYPVIYAPINDITDLTKASFWEIFKDKASYDFRFVSHGLLTSATISRESEEEATTRTRLEEVEAAIELLNSIENLSNDQDSRNDIYFEVIGPKTATDPDLTLALKGLVTTENTVNDEGEKVETKLFYADLTSAFSGTSAEKSELDNLILNYENTAKENEESSVFSAADFNKVNGLIANLAAYSETQTSGRGDCVALIELNKHVYVDNTSTDKPENLIIKGIEGMSEITEDNGSYCTMTVPSVYYNISGVATEFPGAFHYLACFKNSIGQGFKEWYAAAGYTRGVSNYAVDHTSVKLGEIAINALEPRTSETLKFACNVIANFRNSYYLWGNRTAKLLKKDVDLTAGSFLNIRQICTTIKKQLYVACRRFTFDPNSDTLWFNFVNAIKPTLEAMKADQGIRDYRILKVVEDNPKKATLKAKIRIIPIEAVEDFDITVSLEDSFGETNANAIE